VSADISGRPWIDKTLECQGVRSKKARINAGLIEITWWRRGELNPRPQVLDFRIYARS